MIFLALISGFSSDEERVCAQHFFILQMVQTCQPRGTPGYASDEWCAPDDTFNLALKLSLLTSPWSVTGLTPMDQAERRKQY
jgi:hypothetical protein